jgi:hypothetical protein
VSGARGGKGEGEIVFSRNRSIQSEIRDPGQVDTLFLFSFGKFPFLNYLETLILELNVEFLFEVWIWIRVFELSLDLGCLNRISKLNLIDIWMDYWI